MLAYLDLLRKLVRNAVRDEGRVPTRAVLRSTGERIDAWSVFGEQFRCDLRDGFPLLTTKAVHFKSVAVELLWFLRGSITTGFLDRHDVTIWSEWSQDGVVGPIYGAQWRSFQGRDHYTDEHIDVDQVARLLNDIRCAAADPAASCGRRLILTAWNPAQIKDMALPPCHVLSQYLVRDGRLFCRVDMRSCDIFLGLPFNIASYALLTHLLAASTGLGVGELIFHFGDLHLYANHFDVAREQLTRCPRQLPQLHLDVPFGDDLRNIDLRQILLEHRQSPHPALRAEVAV